MFERAIEIDTNYALAYAGIADCCSFLYMYWDGSKRQPRGRRDAAAARRSSWPRSSPRRMRRAGFALSLEPEYDEARREFETAIRLNPKLYEAHYLYARAYIQEGKLEEAVQHYEEAARVRPEDYQAAAECDALADRPGGRGRRAQPRLQGAEAPRAQPRRRARALPRRHRAGAARRARKGPRLATRALALDPDDSGVLYVACVYAVAGRTDRALGCLQDLRCLGTHWQLLETRS